MCPKMLGVGLSWLTTANTKAQTAGGAAHPHPRRWKTMHIVWDKDTDNAHTPHKWAQTKPLAGQGGHRIHNEPTQKNTAIP